MQRYICFFLLWAFSVVGYAQRANYGKMSQFVRELMLEEETSSSLLTRSNVADTRRICAFVRTQENAQHILSRYGCVVLESFGNIHIVDIPMRRMAEMSQDNHVIRIETGQGTTALMDSMAYHINAQAVYEGKNLPQAYTGKGVVVGVQDIGFDLTHPNFYDSTGKTYRVKRFWDHLSTDTVGATRYVGADYTDSISILNYKHSRDALNHTHGTHTLGTAAGSGYKSKYRGIAYESDICVVANATGDNVGLIDKKDYYKYTYATDALGFKYMMDYATSVNKPCVVSFSEGGKQDFMGEDMLYYEILKSLTGPGRIIVAAAGNNGNKRTYLQKVKGRESAGTFMVAPKNRIYTTLKSQDPFIIRMVTYAGVNDSMQIATSDIIGRYDSLYVDTLQMNGKEYRFRIVAYTSSFSSSEMGYDVMVSCDASIGREVPFSLEVVGRDSQVDMYYGVGEWVSNGINPTLSEGDHRYSIFSPGSAPSVICVGATSYRTHKVNSQGNVDIYNQGINGQRANYSAVGPTYDNRIKPDVMAPGTNIISSLNSFYLENNPTAYHSIWSVDAFSFNGRTYAWDYNAGTSMSTPAVAGAIALWLQAKPDLTTDEIKEIFDKTCTRYDASLTYPNNYYGYGQIDVYRGLLEVLKLTSIQDISMYQPAKVNIMPVAGQQVRFVFADASTRKFKVKVFSVSGALVLHQECSANSSTYELDLSRLPSGVYAIQMNGNTPELIGSTLVRL